MKNSNATLIIIISLVSILVIFLFGALTLAQLANTSKDTSSVTVSKTTKTLSPFTKIELQSSYTIKLIQAEQYAVRLSADSIQSQSVSIKASVSESQLRITDNRRLLTLDNPFSPTSRKTIEVLAPNFTAIKVFSDGLVTGTDLTGDSIQTEVNGSGRIEINNVKYTEVQSAIFGSGDITIAGETDKLVAKMSGSGTIYNQNLRAKTAKIDLNGSGFIKVNASDELDAVIQGSGKVLYSGKPKITKEVSGSGQLAEIV
jgi:hypothetical protein